MRGFNYSAFVYAQLKEDKQATVHPSHMVRQAWDEGAEGSREAVAMRIRNACESWAKTGVLKRSTSPDMAGYHYSFQKEKKA